MLAAAPWGPPLSPQVGAACGLPPQGIDVWDASRRGRQLLTELLVDQFQVAAVLPRLPQRPLDLLHPVPELPVPLLQGGHLLLQFLDMVLLLKQGLLHGRTHELGTQTPCRERQVSFRKSAPVGIPNPSATHSPDSGTKAPPLMAPFSHGLLPGPRTEPWFCFPCLGSLDNLVLKKYSKYLSLLSKRKELQQIKK